MILNIRGANGSGKSTIARHFAAGCPVVRLALYKTDAGKSKEVIGYENYPFDTCVVGSYVNACGGLDTVPDFATSFEAIEAAADVRKNVICEGILASTVFGSWADFAKKMKTDPRGPFAFLYLSTPLDECLRRIYARNGGKKIKEELVRNKVKAIAATRLKAKAIGMLVYDLPAAEPINAVKDILQGTGEMYRAK